VCALLRGSSRRALASGELQTLALVASISVPGHALLASSARRSSPRTQARLHAQARYGRARRGDEKTSAAGDNDGGFRASVGSVRIGAGVAFARSLSAIFELDCAVGWEHGRLRAVAAGASLSEGTAGPDRMAPVEREERENLQSSCLIAAWDA
jgi:hypothetical protein